MKKKKRFVTLIEIMIVILLIGIIGGVLAFNMKGSLDKGREFKTKQNKQRIEDILNLELATSDKSSDKILNEWSTIVKNSPLSAGEQTTKTGNNALFVVTFEKDAFIATPPKK